MSLIPKPPNWTQIPELLPTVWAEQQWEGRGSSPRAERGAEVWRASMSLSLSLSRSICTVSLAVAVCHAAERRGSSISPHTLQSRLNLLQPRLQKEDVSSSSPYTLLKGPFLTPEGPLLFLRLSICRAFASIHLPSYPSSCILAPFLFDSGRSQQIPQ